MRNRQIAAYVAFGGITAAGVALAATSFPLLDPVLPRARRPVRRHRARGQARQRGERRAVERRRRSTGRALAEPVARAWWAPGRVRALAELRVAIADALDGQRRAGARARPPRPRAAVAAPDPAPVLVLHRDQPPHRARPHQGGAPSSSSRAAASRPARCSGCRTGSRRCTSARRRGRDPDRGIDDTELHDRMRKGLSMTAGRDLLLLCAWAYAQRGEHDDARFAWRQAMEREGSQRLEVAMPKLAEWMAEYRKDAPRARRARPRRGRRPGPSPPGTRGSGRGAARQHPVELAAIGRGRVSSS